MSSLLFANLSWPTYMKLWKRSSRVCERVVYPYDGVWDVFGSLCVCWNLKFLTKNNLGNFWISSKSRPCCLTSCRCEHRWSCENVHHDFVNELFTHMTVFGICLTLRVYFRFLNFWLKIICVIFAYLPTLFPGTECFLVQNLHKVLQTFELT